MNEPSQVGVLNFLRSRSVAPVGAVPVSTEWWRGFTAFSSASR